MKISIIGAGNVGSALAERVLTYNVADVVLVDIAEDLAMAKAMDLTDASPLAGYSKRIIGTEGYKDTEGSRVVFVTAGFPRKPGMSRDDLIAKNARIIKEVVKNVKAHSPEAILVLVTNPLDVMTFIAYKEIGCERNRILGMAGNLDAARFMALLSNELNIPHEKIETFVLGSHGDTMVPILSKTKVDKRLLKDVLGKEEIERLVEETKKRGGEVVRLLKSGSAYFSPSAACLEILKAIIGDEKKVIPCSCILEGEYGLKGCAIGVPAVIGKNGIHEILEWDLPEDEERALKNSAKAVKDAINVSCNQVTGE